MEPLPKPIAQALKCADVAYFEYTCVAADMAHYMEHCENYPLTSERSSLKERLDDEERSNVRKAMERVVESASCKGAAEQLKDDLSKLDDESTRTTLRLIMMVAAAALDKDKSNCEYRTNGRRGVGGGDNYEGLLRKTFGHDRLVAGMLDIGESCAMFQGLLTAQTKHLAQKMAEEFDNKTWLANYSQRLANASEVMKCGDLDVLKTTGVDIQEPLWGFHELLLERNQKLAKSIETAMDRHRDKTLVLVVGLPHLVNTAEEVQGVPELLRQAGVDVERVGEDEDLVCNTSTVTLLPNETVPEAEKLRHCLLPPYRAQPPSCLAFNHTIYKKLGKDPLYGRKKFSKDCPSCVASNSSCTCTILWNDTESFRDLCLNTTVNGTSGHVIETDMVRNAGSVHSGVDTVEKTVRSLEQKCIATTCDVGLFQEMELRQWYAEDPSLALGVVKVNGEGGGPLSFLKLPENTPFLPWWAWLAIGLLIAGVIIGAICCLLAKCHAKSLPEVPGSARGTPLSAREWKQPSKVADTMPHTPLVQEDPHDADPSAADAAAGAHAFGGHGHFGNHLVLQAMHMKHQMGTHAHHAMHGMHQMKMSALHGLGHPVMAHHGGGAMPPHGRYEQLSQQEAYPGSPMHAGSPMGSPMHAGSPYHHQGGSPVHAPAHWT